MYFKNLSLAAMLTVSMGGMSVWADNPFPTTSPKPVEGTWADGEYHWYYVHCIGGQQVLRPYIVATNIDSRNSNRLVNSIIVSSEDVGYLWSVVPNGDGSYSFYNNASGEPKILVQVNTNSADSYSNMYMYSLDADMTGVTDRFEIKSTTGTNGTAGYWRLWHPDGKRSVNNLNQIGFWGAYNNTNPGDNSTFEFIEYAADRFEIMQKIEDLRSEIVDDKIGKFDGLDIEAGLEKIDLYLGVLNAPITDDFIAKYNELKAVADLQEFFLKGYHKYEFIETLKTIKQEVPLFSNPYLNYDEALIDEYIAALEKGITNGNFLSYYDMLYSNQSNFRPLFHVLRNDIEHLHVFLKKSSSQNLGYNLQYSSVDSWDNVWCFLKAKDESYFYLYNKKNKVYLTSDDNTTEDQAKAGRFSLVLNIDGTYYVCDADDKSTYLAVTFNIADATSFIETECSLDEAKNVYNTYSTYEYKNYITIKDNADKLLNDLKVAIDGVTENGGYVCYDTYEGLQNAYKAVVDAEYTVAMPEKVYITGAGLQTLKYFKRERARQDYQSNLISAKIEPDDDGTIAETENQSKYAEYLDWDYVWYLEPVAGEDNKYRIQNLTSRATEEDLLYYIGSSSNLQNGQFELVQNIGSAGIFSFKVSPKAPNSYYMYDNSNTSNCVVINPTVDGDDADVAGSGAYINKGNSANKYACVMVLPVKAGDTSIWLSNLINTANNALKIAAIEDSDPKSDPIISYTAEGIQELKEAIAVAETHVDDADPDYKPYETLYEAITTFYTSTGIKEDFFTRNIFIENAAKEYNYSLDYNREIYAVGNNSAVKFGDINVASHDDQWRYIWTVVKVDGENAFKLYNQYTKTWVMSTSTVGRSYTINTTSDESKAGVYRIGASTVKLSTDPKYGGSEDEPRWYYFIYDSHNDYFNLSSFNIQKINMTLVNYPTYTPNSQFHIDIDAVPKWFEKYVESLDDALASKNPGGYDENSSVKDALDAFKEKPGDYDTYVKLEESMKNSVIKPEFGKYYHIYSSADKNETPTVIKESYTTARTIFAECPDNDIVPYLWRFDKVAAKSRSTETQYTIVAPNTGLTLAATTMASTANTTNTHTSESVVATVDASLETPGALTIASGDSKVNVSINNSADLILKQVYEIPVKIGACGYTMIMLPMAVEFRDLGIEVYSAGNASSLLNGEIELFSLDGTNGVIPANTPVLITGVANKIYSLPICDDDTQSPVLFDMEGSNVPYSLTEAAYTEGTSTSMIKRAVGTNISYNKAWIPALEGDADEKSFDTGRKTTGSKDINIVDKDSLNGDRSIIYDINGRRILNTEPGQIYVRGDGSKFLQK